MLSSNIMLGEKNSLNLYGLKELVVMGKAVLAVIVGVWLFGGVVLRAYPESYQTLSSYMSWKILFCPKEDTLKVSSLYPY